MKKVLAILVVFSLLVIPASFAADKVTKNVERAIKGEGVDWAKADNIITVNPLIFIGFFSAHYEMAMGKTNGLGFNGLFSWFGLGDWSWTTIGAGAEYNWYFQKHALNGWFAGPGASIVMTSFGYKNPITNETKSASVVGIGINGHGGYRWVWDGGFTLDLQASLGMNFASAVTIDGVTASGYGGFGFSPGLNLGYAW